MSSSRTPSLTSSLSSRSCTPCPPVVQPDHFFGADDTLPSPTSVGRPWLTPEDDPLAHRGIPVFKPTMDEFRDFEDYMKKVECWGERSGIIKIIPPKEWSESLPPIKEQLNNVKISSPIEQHMQGRAGLFRVENMMRRKYMSVREWVEMCDKEDYRAPGVHEVGLHGRSGVRAKTRRSKRFSDNVKAESADAEDQRPKSTTDGPGSANAPIVVEPLQSTTLDPSIHAREKPEMSAKRPPGRKKTTTEKAAERSARDAAFLKTFDPYTHWLPPGTTSSDYTPEFCHILERQFWRSCGLGKPAWYGADSQGTLFTDQTQIWNVGHLESALTRLLPSSSQGLPGVNTPYLYWGMWRASFAWHVEDMDLFSINYIHFGAPKFWYAIPQGRAGALEQTMRSYFPKDGSQCSQFLRHKSYLASATLLAQSSCRPNHCVQHAGEIIITYPLGYHAGFNLGLNCAESVNFALDSWISKGIKAKACECIPDSVRIDVEQLLRDREAEGELFAPTSPPQPKRSSMKKEISVVIPSLKTVRPPKRQHEDEREPLPKAKKVKLAPPKSMKPPAPVPSTSPVVTKVTLKLGPRPSEPEHYPCCLCISTSTEGLLRVQDPPIGRRDAVDAAGHPSKWMAHESCANIVPETWVDEVDETNGLERVVFGVDGIVRDRWNLKCSACTKSRPRAHGAPIQCTKGKCPKAFHYQHIIFETLREVEKEVVLLDSNDPGTSSDQMQVDSVTGLPTDDSRVLKVIKKVEVRVLCTQHNPFVAAAKKASKQDKIRNELMTLPDMARIKIRVSAGVFEVSLVRVIEETGSVEVLWDRGSKREFKWGSVVFGNTDGPVVQKPSEAAPEPPAPTINTEASTSQNTKSPVPTAQYGSTAPPNYSANPYAYWGYQVPGQQSGASAYPYQGYYTTAAQFYPYTAPQPKGYSGKLQWQQPYQDERHEQLEDSHSHISPSPSTATATATPNKELDGCVTTDQSSDGYTDARITYGDSAQ
ncbi:JmjC domain, hydroxylase-domain-containing protein [Desarmillaria tabescens]|uniref:JmjC domain, hydroxylase-domain-containing protein n=1 Tax=Armillaria tabescens TaxID=1929756 RepID=A0AA39MV95_ARMTA|nr:JmjC domain, hydroxylase-domain-containing protein [Desarmillaria tabescens]KAK0447453.1 JmjC domain, hydroxylase-domain-containing protein [Desarmillaria tabescens]